MQKWLGHLNDLMPCQAVLGEGQSTCQGEETRAPRTVQIEWLGGMCMHMRSCTAHLSPPGGSKKS
jgi:hypothetical protein